LRLAHSTEREGENENDARKKQAGRERRVREFFYHLSLAASQDGFKGIFRLSGTLPTNLLSRSARFAPFGTVFYDPIRQGPLEPNIASGLFRLDPLVLQDFLAFSLKLTVQRRVF
jgi:hypothetical protein